MNRRLNITHHAIERYQQRVAPEASKRSAANDISRLLETAHSRSRPRWWTRIAGEEPGCRYLYSANHAEVCLVVRGDAVVTVFSRSVCARWRADRPAIQARQSRPVPGRCRRRTGAPEPEWDAA